MLAAQVITLAALGRAAWLAFFARRDEDYLRIREPWPARVLRALHTGSANDYGAYAVAGTLAVIAVLALA